MRRLAVPALVFSLCLVALCLFVVFPLGTAASTGAGGLQTDDSRQQVPVFDAADSQRIVFDLQRDGDATLAVSFVFDVRTRDERDAFQATAAEFKRTGFVWPFFNNTVTSVSEYTGREMTLEGPRRTSRLDAQTDTGTLTARMTWQEFGNVSNGTVVVEDAFYVADGVPWIRQLGPNQRLVIVGPDGYEFAGASDGPRFTDNRLIWVGQQNFEEGDLRASWKRGQGGIGMESIAAGFVTLLVVGLAFYAARQYSIRSDTSTAGSEPDPSPSGPVTDTDGGAPAAAADTPPEQSVAEQETPTAGADPDSNSSPDPAAGTAREAATAEEAMEGSPADAAASDDDADGVDLELLSDEERVERMLDQNGGRMKQANIVKETGWSNAKVSQLLSQMDEDDRIDKLRIGRENLISLPDEDITTIE
jgi:hypothetical protein